MNVFNLFDSRFMKAEDLKGPTIVTIERVDTADMESGKKLPVIHTKELGKPVVINFNSARRIALMYGEETDAWNGKRITIFRTSTIDNDGQTVPCIRVKSQPPKVKGSRQ